MTIQESANLLKNQLCNNDWFFDISILDKQNVVYVHSMDISVFTTIPNEIDNCQVLVHFANEPEKKSIKHTNPIIIEEDESNEPDLDYLIYQLDKAEKICGPNILEDIFFEIKDQNNAVTNLSAKFPEVRKIMDELYETFGFDVVYNELEITI